MDQIHTIEPAYHPKGKMGFTIDWVPTLKCNYDCSYCVVGPNGHDNSTKHPSLDKCLTMLKQMYRYTDVMMQPKKIAFKDTILNISGGESLFHPEIEKILIATTQEYEQYADRWRLKRTITTNATATEKKWKTVCDNIEKVTFSYHSEGPEKMKTIFKKNIDHVLKIKKDYDIVLCVFPLKPFWQDCLNFLKYCEDNKLRVRPKLLDGRFGVYSKEQLAELAPYFKNSNENIQQVENKSPVYRQTRACCGGRQMCTNRDLKHYQTQIPRSTSGFEGWHCSANQFFLHGNNVYETYYTTKDCYNKLDGTIGPIATMDTMEQYIEQIKSTKQPMILKCAQKICQCGTCAPKSIHKQNLLDILKIYNH